MPNTYGGAISQGISQGLGNVSAIYGLQNQMRQSQREDELYNIKMKEYQKGLEPADWGKIGNFLDAGEEGLGYAKAYAGALGKDPDKMTRSDMREFGEIFLKDQKAAHDILQFRRRHYGQKVKEYEGKLGLESEYGMFKEKFDQATMLDKTYREAQTFRQEQEQIQKIAQAMQKVAGMSDEELSLKGYPPIMRDMAASGDIQGFRSIAGKIAEAQVKKPGDTFKIGQTRVIQKGDQSITEEYTATGWKEIGKGPKFKTSEGEKSGQNWLLPDRSIVISYDGGRTYTSATGQSKPMPSTAMKVPGGATLGELNANEAKKEAERELSGGATGTGISPRAAALKGTGPYERLASMFEAVAGGAGLDVLVGQNGFFPEMADAKQYLRSVKQMGKAALMNSSRGAIWEQQRIDELFPDPDKTFTNPRIEARKFGNLLGILRSEKAFNNQAIVKALTPKEIEKYRASNNEIDRLMSLISEPSTGGIMGGITAQDKSLVDKYRRRK